MKGKKASLAEENSKSSYIYICLGVLSVSLTACVFGPLELYLHNINEFWFSISSVAGGMLVVFLAVTAVLGIPALFLRGKARRIYICLLFGLGLALYLQRNFLNAGTSILDGRAVNWLAEPGRVIGNTVIWIACLAVPVAVGLLVPKVWKTMVGIGSVMVIGVQLSSVVFLGATAVKTTGEVQLTQDGMFELSKEKNIIVFVVDTMDAQFFEQYVMDEPEYAQNLQDFTYFDNAVSGGGPTMYGLPVLLTGMNYTGEDYDIYLEKAYESAELYPKLKNNGYDVRIYTDDQFVSDAYYSEYVDNAAALKLVPSSRSGLLARFYQFWAYEYAPVVLKNGFYLYSGVFDEYKTTASDASEPYILDDAAFIRDYRDTGLIAEEEQPAFRLYHLFGAHGPYTLDEKGGRSDEPTTLVQQIHGVMSAIFEYIDQLREMGLYDGSTIIISGDHGALDVYQNPMFLIKTADSTQDALRISSAPITFQNVPPTLSEAIDGSHRAQERTVFQVGEQEDITRFQMVTFGLVNKYYGYDATQVPHLFQVGNPARDTAALIDLGEIDTVRSTEPYVFGRHLNFTKGDSDDSQYLFEGFSGTDVGGTWTTDVQAVQRFAFAEAPEQNLLVQVELAAIFLKSQFVTVYFNDICVFSRYLSETEFSFVVPIEAVREGEQEIRYELSTNIPDTSSDHANDSRSLSLRFAGMTISETNLDSTVTEPINRYTWGDEIIFVPEDDGRRYFSAGIASIETDCAWSMGTEGQIQLLVDEPAGDLIAEFHFKRIYSPPQRFLVKCRGQVLLDETLNEGDNSVTFTIPTECVYDGRLVLDLEYPDALTPKSQGESGDMRLLAVRFTSICFTEGGDTP